MTTLTNYSPASSYGDLLTTTNDGGGLTDTLSPVQDGFGNNSAIQLSKTTINIVGSGGLQVNGVDLTPTIVTVSAAAAAASINGMFASPVPILASPGAGSMIVIHRFTLEIVSTLATPFLLGGNVYLQYGATGASTNYATSSTAIPNTFIQQAANRAISVSGQINDIGAVTPGLATSVAANAAVTLTNAGVPFTTGTGSIRYTVWYSIMSIA